MSNGAGEDRKSTILTIVGRLMAPIPARPKPPVRPRATWAGLKVGDRLRENERPTEVQWEVEATDSNGATLRVVVPFKSVGTLRIETKEVLAHYTKVKKPRTRKPKVTPTEVPSCAHDPDIQRRGEGSDDSQHHQAGGGVRRPLQ